MRNVNKMIPKDVLLYSQGGCLAQQPLDRLHTATDRNRYNDPQPRQS